MGIAKLKNNEVFKKISVPILLDFKNSNGDYGFFEEVEEVFYPNNGVKIASTLENINYTFQEIDYYLLDNNKVGKFKRNISIANTSRELLNIYSITDFKKKYKRKSQCEELKRALTLILKKKTS